MTRELKPCERESKRRNHEAPSAYRKARRLEIRAREQAQQDVTVVSAVRQGAPWSDADDRALAALDHLTAFEAALAMGRTARAVSHRRRLLISK